MRNKNLFKFVKSLLSFSFLKTSNAEANQNDGDLIFPNDEDGDVLRVLQKNGFDFSIEHIFEYAHIFKDKDSAQKFAEEVEKQHMQAEIDYFEELSAWDVIVKVKHAPTHNIITNKEMELEIIAEKYNGRKGGWGVFQTPK